MVLKVSSQLTRFAVVLLTVLGLLSPQPAQAATGATRTAQKTTQKTPTRAAKTYTANAARARRARLVNARAAARARDMRDAQTPRFKIDESGQEVPDVRAEAAIIYNPVTREVLWSSNAES